MLRFLRNYCAFVAVLSIAEITDRTTSAQTIWSGLTTTFTKAALSDGNLPQNQDRLTDSVALTRLSTGGLINFVGELFYDSSVSPIGTKWATDLNNPGQSITATNWQNLSFTDWIDAYGGAHTSGTSIAGRNAVVYLVTDNIYLDLKFTSWTSGTGGGYGYSRAEPPSFPSPTGDYNQNGVVDAADYVVWRETLNQAVASAGSGADGDSSGTIDIGDVDYWRARFGNSTGSVSTAGGAVPEPTFLFLVLNVGFLATFNRFDRQVER